MEGAAFVFLNGLYQKGDMAFVGRLIRRRRPKPMVVAVDGGFNFLQKIAIKPDVWISDLDSAPRFKGGVLKNTVVLLYPSDKGKTDAELALEYCVQEKIFDITVFGWDSREGEIDHLLGNLFLCRNRPGPKRNLRLRFLDCRREIMPIHDESRLLRGFRGRRLSIIPIGARISLSLTGTQYPAQHLTIRAGQTLALRNRITSERAQITVKGSGLVILA